MPACVFNVFVFNVEQSGKHIPIVLFKKILIFVYLFALGANLRVENSNEILLLSSRL